MPSLSARGSTCYGPVFRFLRAQIDRDIDQLKSEGYGVYRPAVFFLAEGAPNDDDDWRPTLRELKDAGWNRHPTILAFGINGADPQTINEIASRPESGWIAAGAYAEMGKQISAFFAAVKNLFEALGGGGSASDLELRQPQGFSVAADLIASPDVSLGSMWPIYLAIDSSEALTQYLGAMERGLSELLEWSSLDAMTSAKIRLTMLGFADEVVCYLDLVDLRDVRGMPNLAAEGSTRLGPVVRDIRSRIDADVDRLTRMGYIVRKPLVLFLVASDPVDADGRMALSELHDPHWKNSPEVMAVGLCDLSPRTLGDIATRPALALLIIDRDTIPISRLLEGLLSATEGPDFD
jgi:uncharacterized protein YegL